jgi:hypothetical protein
MKRVLLLLLISYVLFQNYYLSPLGAEGESAHRAFSLSLSSLYTYLPLDLLSCIIKRSEELGWWRLLCRCDESKDIGLLHPSLGS